MKHQKTSNAQKGVRQGCNLSSLLFNLFLKGLELKLADNQAGVPLGETTIDTIMFAENIILLSTCIEGIRKHKDHGTLLPQMEPSNKH